MIIVLVLGSLILLVILGAPIFAAMGAASALHWLEAGRPGTAVVLMQRLFDGASSFSFMAVPMFLLAAELMTRGGLTDRMINLARALVGHWTGGLAQVNILSSVFFGGVSGSAHADVAAIGSVLIPAMKREGYPPGFAGALTAATGTLSPLIPPSIVLIIYGATFNVSIGALFAAAISVAAVLAVGFFAVTYVMVKTNKSIPRHPRASWSQRLYAMVDAIPALGMPIIILGGIFFGIVTATEAASVAVAYALCVSMLIYRTIRLRDLPQILWQTAMLSAAVGVLVAVAVSYSYVMVARSLPEIVMGQVIAVSSEPAVIMSLIIAALLIAGMFIDRTSNILLFGAIVIPLLTVQLGFSQIQTAMIIVSALGVGHLTPPVGGTLMTTALVGRMSILEITRYMWPYILLKIGVAILIVSFPAISETLPRALGLGGL